MNIHQKKKRTKIHSGVRINIEGGPKVISRKPKPLTASQRIARLKRKSAMLKAAISQPKAMAIQKDQPQGDALRVDSNQTTENLDHMFDSIVNVDSSSGKSDDALNGAAAHHSSIISVEESVIHNDESVIQIDEPSKSDVSRENFNMVQLMLQMQNQMNDLGHSVTILRKQLARIEVKSSHMCSCTTRVSNSLSSNSLSSADVEGVLFDFDGALSREGLPLDACIKVNEFEIKLRSDEFRNKMVSMIINC